MNSRRSFLAKLLGAPAVITAAGAEQPGKFAATTAKDWEPYVLPEVTCNGFRYFLDASMPKFRFPKAR